MDRRYQKVGLGVGAFHNPPRAKYSEDTRNLIKPNKDKQKRHLACMMAFGKDMPETPHGPKILHRAKREPRAIPEDVDPLDELVNAIQERMEFLNDMESLGMDKKYRPIIQQEIAQKLRLIEAMDKEMPEETRKKITEFMYERPPPKPFPMGDLDEN